MLIFLVLILTVPCVICQINETDVIKIDDTLCSGTVCRGFDFPSTHRVVFFEDNNDNQQKVLRFEDSTFANFPLNMFLAFTKATEVDMRNCSVEHMTWENFLWAVELRVLLLSNNLLTKIDVLTFSYALNMQFLWLESNRIRTLVSESFKGLTQLKYLSLQNNRIMHLPDGLFDDLRSLEVVILAENKIKFIQDDLFTKSPKLLSIDLKANRIHNISDDAFKNLGNLMNLDISRNKPLRSLIANLDVSNLYADLCSLRQMNIYGHVNFAMMSGNRILELYFSKPESLQRLDLKNNSLQQIASLTRAKNLVFLDVSDNPKLESVPDPWGVGSLQKLDMSNAGLKDFPDSILGKRGGAPLQLNFLNISNNLIRQIDPRLFSRMENITNFYFHGNDWNCYHLKLMMDLLIVPNEIAYSGDEYDPQFPGEYIGGVKCLYRIVEDENNDPPLAKLKTEPTGSEAEEIFQLRNELKTIVRFFEDKFVKVFATIDSLQSRLDSLTAENATVWQHITVTT